MTSAPFGKVYRATEQVAASVKETVRWARQQRAIGGLGTLNDHLLQDIGCHRSEIPRIARSAEVVRVCRPIGEPKEIASAAILLATSDFITGTVVNVDGGHVAGHALQ